MKQTFETTLPGYDGSTDETDHLIVWIHADNEAQVRSYIPAGFTLHPIDLGITSDTLSDTELRTLGIDYILPQDATALRERAFPTTRQNAALPSPAVPGPLGDYLLDPAQRWAVSYGPRRDVGESTEPCAEADAQFWGVYRYDVEGIAKLVGDAHDKWSAEQFAEIVRRDVLRERGFTGVPVGTPAVGA